MPTPHAITPREATQRLDQVRRVYFEQGDLERTLQGYTVILAECEAAGAEIDALAMCCRDIADILYELGEKADAFKMYDRALAYVVSDENIRAHTLMNKGICLIQEGKREGSIALFAEANHLGSGPLKQIVEQNYKVALAILRSQEKADVDVKTERQIRNS